MQGKALSEQTTDSKATAGIDVSKSWLDAHIVPQGVSLRVDNDAGGHRKLARWFAEHGVVVVVTEATGKLHRKIHVFLHRLGFKVAVMNPRRVRLIAEGLGELAKTDRIDARVLAVIGATLSPAARPPAPEIMQELQELVTARETAVRQRTSLKNQFAAATTKFLVKQLKRRIAQGDKDIAELETEIEKVIRSDEVAARRYAILRSIPGIALVCAATLIAKMSELGACSAKQIAALAGLCPFDRESGTQTQKKKIRGGRAAVRWILCQCAQPARRGNRAWKTFSDRLLAKGKPKIVARIAVARKLLIAANVLIAEDRLWRREAPVHP